MFKNASILPKVRNIRYLHKWNANNVRKQFLDYFLKENGHNFVRSSPVVPFCDPTVAFVNAGMNQFKGIFLGHQKPTYTKVANSQKCVRVGGKHNDLSIIGMDGHHHTFFEMLGNWSFGDYFKEDACKLAWNLLTGPYQLDPSHLYITYFGGDQSLNLGPDLECKDIWRSLGVPDDHIIPFGLKENFWEMGSTGPCGPCTEIHIDHTKSTALRSNHVNKDLPDLTELWNIVFIQYNRNGNGDIDLLPKKHVDTGMGFERLTAILQNKSSNYDTDVFTTLFSGIEKNCKGLPKYSGKFGTEDANGLDTAYRILADHSRTVTVCLADGMIPEQNQKLRKIIRKSFYLSENVFKNPDLLKILSLRVAENLGETYPGIIKNINQIQEIISYEQEIYKSLRETASKSWSNILKTDPKLKEFNVLEMPGLISAYNELNTTKPTKIGPELAFRLYDTHGLDGDSIQNLANALNLSYDPQELKSELNNAKSRTKERFLQVNSLSNVTKLLENTSQSHDAKYRYKKEGPDYHFEDLDVQIFKIIQNDQLVNEVTQKECTLILNDTNFYTEAGGQIFDKGLIKFPNNTFTVTEVNNLNGHVLHKGIFEQRSPIKINDRGALLLDKERRLNVMTNHTAVHLLNAAIKNVLQVTTCQKSSAVFPEHMNFDVGVYGKKLSVGDIEKIEGLIRSVVKKGLNVETKLVDSQELLSLDDVTMIPGEVYPENDIRLINIKDNGSSFSSCEPCCGTHILNTSDIIDFCITNCKSLGRSTSSLTAVTRDKAVIAHKNGEMILEKVENLKQKTVENSNEIKEIDDNITEIRNEITRLSEQNLLPIYVKTNCLDTLGEIGKKIRGNEREILKDLINLEMNTAVSSNRLKSAKDNSFIVHFLECSSMLENVQLQQATKICPDIPVIVVSYSENMVKARCCVPKQFVSKIFNADNWLNASIGHIFKSRCSPPKGQEGSLVCNMKARKVNAEQWETLLPKALHTAKKFAFDHL